MNCGKLALAALGCVLCISTAQAAIVRGGGAHTNDGEGGPNRNIYISRTTGPAGTSGADQFWIGGFQFAAVPRQAETNPDHAGLEDCVLGGLALIDCDYEVAAGQKRRLPVTASTNYFFNPDFPETPLQAAPTLDIVWTVRDLTGVLKTFTFENQPYDALEWNFSLVLNNLPVSPAILTIQADFVFTLPDGYAFYESADPPQFDVRLVEGAHIGQVFTVISSTRLTIDPASIPADETAPVSSAVPVPGPNAAGWNNMQVNVTITAVDEADGSGLEFVSYQVGDDAADSSLPAELPISVNVNTLGTTNISFFAEDLEGNQEAIKSLVVKFDNTVPTIDVVASPVANVDGWNNSPVTVDFTCTDTPSDIDTCTGDQTLSSEGASQVVNGSATDNAGNSTSKSTTVKIDLTLPTITGAASPAPNAAGWNNSNVTVTFTCTDALSDIKTCPASTTISDNGAGQSATGTATDKAGNSANASVTGIKLDKIAPVVTVTGVTDGATYPPGGAPATGCSTTDAHSGVATAATLALTGGTSNGVGSFTAACTGALDKADNPGSASATYEVQYDYSGFFSPVDNLPIVNSVKAGQAVPVKFRLAGDFGLDVLLVTPQSQSVGCSSALPVDAIEQTVVAGSSSLSYDPLTSLYSYVWKTDKSFKGCRSLIITLDDETVHTAFFKFN